MAEWRFRDGGGCYAGSEAIERALEADGRRTLTHGSLLLELSHEDRPRRQPPVALERRLTLAVTALDWAGVRVVGEGPAAWRSDPIPLLGHKKRSRRPQRVNDVLLGVAGRSFFATVHDELHRRQDGGQMTTRPLAAPVTHEIVAPAAEPVVEIRVRRAAPVVETVEPAVRRAATVVETVVEAFVPPVAAPVVEAPRSAATVLAVRCKSCGAPFQTPVQFDEESLRTVELPTRAYRCPRCRRTEEYGRDDHTLSAYPLSVEA